MQRIFYDYFQIEIIDSTHLFHHLLHASIFEVLYLGNYLKIGFKRADSCNQLKLFPFRINKILWVEHWKENKCLLSFPFSVCFDSRHESASVSGLHIIQHFKRLVSVFFFYKSFFTKINGLGLPSTSVTQGYLIERHRYRCMRPIYVHNQRKTFSDAQNHSIK